ncbi:LPS export ABC transporter periplasmic protein LptC [Croceibacterium sp. LX-88]|uniref:LPS export ABC transporter periplasmic protein LptC n=1 Tax=Croceibacterium selenioxidans TaxID=2838833 RepID=A0ABS5W6T2_9SPHN|nr:LPS export ABC transporter periplasmic protein LptC [Croceibacterium selenioxidans]MBT2135445.1 LPS export ABC transporter periplasmic protein LptC [Croceibacterium selenioxidans]
MSQQADTIRDRRRAFAAPGGSFDRTIRLLAVGLPALVGVVAAFMLITPLGPRGEVSFMLDRNKADIAEDRLRVDNAMYRGRDNKDRPFTLQAGEAVQRSAADPVVQLSNLTAKMQLTGGPALLVAPAGRYYIEDQRVAIDGVVRFNAADGYNMVMRNVSIDLPNRTVQGAGGIQGSVPAGTFSADRLEANLEERVVALDGNARLRMVPGQMRMP